MHQLYCKMRVHSIKYSKLNKLYSQLNATDYVVKTRIFRHHISGIFIVESKLYEIYDILEAHIFTGTEWASVENGLL